MTNPGTSSALNQYLQSTTGGGGFGSGGGDLLQSGPAYNLGGRSAANQAQNNFNQALNAALMSEGIDPNSLTTEQRQQLQTIIYGNPALSALMTTAGQQAAMNQQSGYQGPYAAVNAIGQVLAQTFFPNVGSLTSGAGLQTQDPAAASFGLQLKAQKTGVPQTTAALYQEELLQMGLPADLYSTYSGAVSAWEQFFSGPPTPQELAQLLGVNLPGTGTATMPGASLSQIQQQAERAAANGPSTGKPTGTAMATGPSGGGGGFAAGTKQQYQAMISAASTATGVPSEILSALLIQESGDNPSAISSAGAEGIAQFMPGTASGMGVNPMDPQSAIMGAARLLASNYKEFGNWAEALAAYNAGSGAVASSGVAAEQDNYAQNILSMAQAAGWNGQTGSVNASPSGSAGISGAQTGGAIQLPDPATITQAGMVDKIRQMPSNISGLNMGQYTDIKQMADGVMQNLVGHAASDGVVAAVAGSGYQDTPSLAESYLGSMTTGALDAMGSQVYNNIYAANQSTLQNVYNEQGFDPNLAMQQYQQYYQQNPQENPVLQVPSHPPSHASGQGAAPGARRTVVS